MDGDPGAADAELMAAHVAGDPHAFGVLFARHRDRLWAVALRTAGDPETAADGLQEGLVAAFRRAHSYRGDAAVTTWLHRVVVNACLDRLRAAKVRRADPLPDDVEESGRRSVSTAVGSGPGDASDPADHYARAERRERVLAALRQLPLQQRAALVLVDMEGFTVAEAAAILDCAEGTVKSRCARGRAKLARLLRPLLDDSGPDDSGPDDSGPGSGGFDGETPERDRSGVDDRNLGGSADVRSTSRRGPPGAPQPIRPDRR